MDAPTFTTLRLEVDEASPVAALADPESREAARRYLSSKGRSGGTERT